MPICSTCSGSGSCQNCGGAGKERCSTCNGSGNLPSRCPACGGTGNVGGQTCQNCFGSGSVPELCPSCNGVGSFECNQCRGSGKCKDCSGTGQIPFFSVNTHNRFDKVQKGRIVEALISEINNLTTLDIDFDLETKKRAKRSLFDEPPGKLYLKDPIALLYSIELISFDYEPFSPTTNPVILASSSFINGTDLPNSQTFTNSKNTSDIFSLQITKGVSFSVNVNVHVGAPLISGQAGASFTLSSSTSQTVSQTVSRGWSWSVIVPVPPKSRVEATIMVQEAIFSPFFKAKLRVKGLARGKNEISLPSSNIDIDIPIGEIYIRKFAGESIPSVTPIDEDTVDVTINGQFFGTQGIKLIAETKQFDVETNKLLEEKTLF